MQQKAEVGVADDADDKMQLLRRIDRPPQQLWPQPFGNRLLACPYQFVDEVLAPAKSSKPCSRSS